MDAFDEYINPIDENSEILYSMTLPYESLRYELWYDGGLVYIRDNENDFVRCWTSEAHINELKRMLMWMGCKKDDVADGQFEKAIINIYWLSL